MHLYRGFIQAFAASVLVAILAGCHKTVLVSVRSAPPAIKDAGSTADVPGIPFYAKVGMCKQETTWIEPQYSIEVDIAPKGQPAIVHSMTLLRPKFKEPGTRELLANLAILQAASKAAGVGPDVCEVQKKWNALSAQAEQDARHLLCDMSSAADCVNLDAATADGRLIRTVNKADVVAKPDYTRVYYINAKTPFIGNASVDAKLADDGTLGEGNVQVNDQTASTILSTLGTLSGSFATVKAAELTANGAVAAAQVANPPMAGVAPHFAPACTAPVDWPQPSADVVYKVTVSTEIFIHDHTSLDPNVDATTKSCPVPKNGVLEGSVTIVRKDDSSGGGDSSFKFSGEVTPPKPDPKSK